MMFLKNVPILVFLSNFAFGFNIHIGESKIYNPSTYHRFYKNQKLAHRYDTESDGEFIDAIELFFWGKTNMTVIDVGAFDGNSLKSQSKLLSYIGWRRILIEGSNMIQERAKKLSPESIIVHAVICNESSPVHFLHSKEFGGVLDVMNSSFISQTSPYFLNITRENWKFQRMVQVSNCTRMSKVMEKVESLIGTTHINLMLVHVSSTEYDVLSTINWKLSTFDVIVVETAPFRPIGNREKIIEYLNKRG